MFEKILSAFSLDPEDFTINKFGTGLINRTWKLQSKTDSEAYILQQVNDAVFKNPRAIAFNIRLIENYLKQHYPHYLFIAPVATTAHTDYYIDKEGGFFRLFPFLENSHSIDVVHSPQQGFEAARQFGRFTKLLSGLDANLLKITLPHFHDLSLRYKDFTQALKNGNSKRIAAAKDAIDYLLQQEHLVNTFEAIKNNPHFKVRVTHHDTKISNVLFDQQEKGLCVIDLDTVMPGYFISDIGDMMRTYLSPASEEEADFSKIHVREDFFRAIIMGYLSELKDELSEVEKGYFVYAAQFIIYMQALRFLTDHLNNDIYYGAQYEGHNLIRAVNQITLLKEITQKEKMLNQIVKKCILEAPSLQQSPM